MPYDKTKDPYVSKGLEARTLFGDFSRSTAKSNTVDLDPYCYIEVTVGGTLFVLPAKNDDPVTPVNSADPSWTNLGSPSAGYMPKFLVRRIHSSSMATVISVERKE